MPFQLFMLMQLYKCAMRFYNWFMSEIADGNPYAEPGREPIPVQAMPTYVLASRKKVKQKTPTERYALEIKPPSQT